MKTSSYPFSNHLIIPTRIRDTKTSELVKRGPFISLKYPGLIHYMPIGDIVLNKLKYLLKSEYDSLGAMEVKIPSYMKRNLLDLGETVEKTFSNKFVMLPPPMEKYMVLTTHEMEILDWLERENISYKSLPIYLSFSKDMLRPIKHPKGILKLREFEVQAMLSLDLDQSGFKKSLRRYAKICESIFNRLKIPYQKKTFNGKSRRGSHLDFDLEYFYRCTEGENVLLLSNGEKEKALSLSMGYRYLPLSNFIEVTNRYNQRINPVVGTYAMGLERLLFASFDSSRDDRGFNLPESIRPFDVSVLVFGNEERLCQKAEKIYKTLSQKGESVLLDDRLRSKRFDKVKLSDYLGIPDKIIVSKSGVRNLKREEG